MKERLFAIGDIHGCFDTFRELVEYNINIRKSDKVVLLGDYIDRGYQSKEVIDYIIELKSNGFDIIPLIGNHESMLLDALYNDDLFPIWFQNGSSETLESFGIKRIKDLDRAYIEFFKSLQHYFSCNQYLFVHAGFNDVVSDPFSDKFQMLWSRREKYTNPVLNEKVIIHGHSPIPQYVCKQLINGNSGVINIDTGCVYTDKAGYGVLSAIELYSMKLYSAINNSHLNR